MINLLKKFNFAILQHNDTKNIQIAFFGYAWFFAVLNVFSVFFSFIFAIIKKDYKFLFIITIIFITITIIFLVVKSYLYRNSVVYGGIYSTSQIEYAIKLLQYGTLILQYLAGFIYSFYYNKNFLNYFLKNNYSIIYSNTNLINTDQKFISSVNYTEKEIFNYTNTYIKKAFVKFLILLLLVLILPTYIRYTSL